MADKKISALATSTTPLAGTEVIPVVQSGTTKNVSVANLTAGRPTSVGSLAVGFTGTPSAPAHIKGAITVALVESTAANADIQIKGSTSTGYDAIRVNGSDMKFLLDAADILYLYGGNKNVKVNGGNLVIGTAGKGIDFSADGSAAGMTSELLDDYEEGTWTPVLKGNSTDGDYSYSTQRGTYTKIGNRVYVDFKIQVSAINVAATGSFVVIDGLPFTTANNDSKGSVALDNVDFGNGASHLVIGPRSTVSQLTITEIIDNSGSSNVSPADLTATSIIGGSLCYTVA